MYPATVDGQSPEIQFHSHNADDDHHAKYESINIGRIVTAWTPAFQLPAKWARSKIIALAKYYFLEKLVALHIADDIRKMEFGVPITRTFHADIEFVCREFKEKGVSLLGIVSNVHSDAQEDETSSISSFSDPPDSSDLPEVIDPHGVQQTHGDDTSKQDGITNPFGYESDKDSVMVGPNTFWQLENLALTLA
ncbi:hypothetical protein GQ44DRAFT_702875 [Phaeosphaeriaceae sp. PMI808]|nr:hypothetical protein GQ44DRAFT_702875 [Phaeosphaeriaceae sp. PMI808]